MKVESESEPDVPPRRQLENAFSPSAHPSSRRLESSPHTSVRERYPCLHPRLSSNTSAQIARMREDCRTTGTRAGPADVRTACIVGWAAPLQESSSGRI